MKQSLRFIFALTVLCLSFGQATVLAQNSSKSPIVNFEPSSIDFGEVEPGKTYTRTVKVINSGDEIYRNKKTHIEGPLTVYGFFDFSSITTTQPANLTINFKPTEEGDFNGRIYLEGHDVNSANELSITAKVLPEPPKIPTLEFDPVEVDFGEVAVGSSKTLDLRIKNTGNSSFIGKGFITPITAPFSLESISGTSYVFANSNIKGSVTFTPEEAGDFTYTLKYNGNHSNPEAQVIIKGTAVKKDATLSYDPASLDFGQVNLGETLEKTITITNTGEGQYVNTGINIEAPFSVKDSDALSTIAAGASKDITIVFSPVSEGDYNADFSLNGDYTNQDIKVALSGEGYTPKAILHFSLGGINLGEVPLGTTREWPIAVWNDGDKTFYGTGFDIEAPFAVKNSSPMISIEPGKRQIIYIEFTPTTVGEFSSNFTLIGNHYNKEHVLRLGGKGIEGTSVLEFETELVEYGEIPVGETQSQEILVRNSGNIPLTISGFEIEGPFSVEDFEPNMTIKPGSFEHITLKFAPTETGDYNAVLKTIGNHSNPEYTLPVKGACFKWLPNLRYEPYHLNFGTVEVGESKEMEMTIRNESYVPFHCEEFSLGSPFTLKDFDPSTIIEANEEITVTIVFTPEEDDEYATRFYFLGETMNPEWQPYIYGKGHQSKAVLSYDVSSNNFGDVAIGESKEMEVKVYNFGDIEFQSTGVNITEPFTTVDYDLLSTIEPGGFKVIKVKFAPETAADYHTKFSLNGNHSNKEEFLFLSGKGIVEEALLSFDVPTLDFGEVIIGESKEIQITAQNNGNIDFIGSGVNIEAPFTLKDYEVNSTIPATEEQIITIVFTPEEEKDYTATFSLEGNHTNSDLSLAISGKGIAAEATLSYEPASLDFGTVNIGESKEIEVSVLNTGNGIFHATAINIEAPFTAKDFDNASIINPGESLTVKLVFTPEEEKDYTATFSLEGNQNNPESNMTLTGAGHELKAIISFNPEVIDMGEVGTTESKELEVSVQNDGDKDFAITAIHIDEPFSVKNLDLTQVITPGSSLNFIVEFDPEEAGNFSSEFYFEGNHTNKELKLPISGKGVVKDIILTYEPEVLDFGTVNIGESKELEVTVRNTGEAAFFGSAVSIEAPFETKGFNPYSTIPAGGLRIIKVVFSPENEADYSAEFALNGNNTNPDAKMELKGAGYEPKATLSYDPETLDFGTVNIGQSKEMEVTVRNTGDANFYGLGINIEAPFTLNGYNAYSTINAGGLRIIKVVFTPESEDDYTAEFSLKGNHTNADAKMVLNGTGYQPKPVLSYDPETLEFGTVTIGESKEMQITVNNTGDATFFGLGVDIEAPFALKDYDPYSTIYAGGLRIIKVVFTPESEEDFNAEFALKGNHSNADAKMELTGTGYQPKATLSYDPETLDFGTVSIGESKEMEITVHNTGDANFYGLGVNIEAPFTLEDYDPYSTIFAGGLRIIKVVFTPESEDDYTSEFSLEGNHTNADAKMVLNGAGYQPVATLSYDPATLDFGDVIMGESKEMEITVHNTGDAIFFGTGANIEAPFTLKDYDPYSTITAGGLRIIKVVFTPESEGDFNASFSLVGNQTNPELNATLTGKCIPAEVVLSYDPISADFGTVNIGETKEYEITVHNNGNSTFFGTGVNIEAPFATKDFDPYTTIPAGGLRIIKLEFTPTSEQEVVSEFSLVGNHNNPLQCMSLVGKGHQTKAVLSFEPESIDFGFVSIGESKEIELTVHNTGDAIFFGTGVNIEAPFSTKDFDPYTTIAAGGLRIIKLVFTPESAEDYTSSFSLEGNHVNPEAEMSLTGKGSYANPHIKFSVDELDFGMAQINEAKEMELTITNQGNAEFRLNSVQLEAPFYCDEFTEDFKIAANAEVTVIIKFIPATGGKFEQALLFIGNHDNNGESVILKGENPVGLEEINTVLRLAPNPAHNYIEVQASEMIEHITIYDITGNNVKYQTINATGANVNITDLRQGIYLIAIQTPKGQSIRKIVKK